MRTPILVNGERFEVEVLEQKRDSVTFSLGERTYHVEFERSVPQVAPKGEDKAKRRSGASRSPAVASARDGAITAPIPGVVIKILVNLGQSVAAGETLIQLEAMKMENNISSPISGLVDAIHVAEGDEVADQQLLLVVTPA